MSWLLLAACAGSPAPHTHALLVADTPSYADDAALLDALGTASARLGPSLTIHLNAPGAADPVVIAGARLDLPGGDGLQPTASPAVWTADVGRPLIFLDTLSLHQEEGAYDPDAARLATEALAQALPPPGQDLLLLTDSADWFSLSGWATAWRQTFEPALSWHGGVIIGRGLSAYDHQQHDGREYVATGIDPNRPLAFTASAFHHALALDLGPRHTSVQVINLEPVLGQRSYDPAGSQALIPTELAPTLTRELEQMKLLEVSPRRRAIARPEQVVAALGLDPRDRVLDLGAGAGLYTRLFADAVPQGRVYASEIDWYLYRTLLAVAKERPQVQAIFVDRDPASVYGPLAPLDLIFAAEVYEYLPDPAAFFAQLLPLLRPGTGRLALIYLDPDPDLDAFQITDGPALMAWLASDQAPAPVVDALSPAVRTWLSLGGGEAPPDAIEASLVADLDALMDDPRFPEHLQAWLRDRDSDNQLTDVLYPRDLELVRWLSRDLADHGAFATPFEDLAPEDSRALRAMNRALIEGLLQEHGVIKTIATPLVQNPRALYVGPPALIRTVEGAGFHFDQRVQVQPYHDLYLFTVAP